MDGTQSFPEIVKLLIENGLQSTLILFFLTLIFGLILGMIIAKGRMSKLLIIQMPKMCIRDRIWGRLPLFPYGEAPCPVQPCGCDDSCACAPQPGFCHNCGRPIGDCCGSEPPSFCPFCGRRLF